MAAVSGASRTWYATDALGSVRQTQTDGSAGPGTTSYDPCGTLQGGALAPFGVIGGERYEAHPRGVRYGPR